jgi:hypothetical protein
MLIFTVPFVRLKRLSSSVVSGVTSKVASDDAGRV